MVEMSDLSLIILFFMLLFLVIITGGLYLTLYRGKPSVPGFAFFGFLFLLGLFVLTYEEITVEPINPPVVKVHEKFQGNLQPNSEEIRNHYLGKIEENQRKQEENSASNFGYLFLLLPLIILLK